MADDVTIANPAPAIPEFVQQYLDGKSIAEIATDARRCRQTIYNWLHSEESDHYYRSLVKQGLINRLADAEQRIEESASMLDYVRARELLASIKWQLERRVKMFSPKQEVTADTSLTIIVQRQGETPRDITPVPAQLSGESNDINNV